MTAIRIIDDHLELANIGTKTHAEIDAHIAAADNYVKRDGSLALSSDWDIGDTRKILADEIRARDGAGLKLHDDGSNGIFVKDGGSVGVGTAVPSATLDVVGTLDFSDVTGDVSLFDNELIGNTTDGNSFYVRRHASESNRYFRLYIDQYENAKFRADASLKFDAYSYEFMGDNNEVLIGGSSTGGNPKLKQFGKITAAGPAVKYIQWRVDDVDDNFELSRQDSNIGYFDIQMPVIMTGGNVGIGTTTPTAKLDIDSDIFRVRTAKTPASAGAAGNTGDRAWDADYFYICVATNTWERTAHATWV